MFARMRSIVSHAASPSASRQVLDSSSIAAATSRSRHGPASSMSAARANGALRSSQSSRPHHRAALVADLIASPTCSGDAQCTCPSWTECACGVTIGIVCPVGTSRPPMMFGMS